MLYYYLQVFSVLILRKTLTIYILDSLQILYFYIILWYGDSGDKMRKDINLVNNIFKGILVYFLFSNSYLLQYIPVIVLKMNVENISLSMNILLSAFSNCIVFMILFFIFRKELKKEWLIFKNKFMDNMDIGIKYWFCGLVGMFASNLLLIYGLNTGQAGNEQVVQKMIDALPWLMLIETGFIAPFVEEIVFRKTFRNIFKNKWLFILISGFTFGLVHVLGNITVWTDILFIIPYSSLGLAFAAAYNETDTVFTPIALHMMHNILLTIISII